VKVLLTVFMISAAAGLLLSLGVHCLALMGISNPVGDAAWSLHVGIFVVWIPAVLVTRHLVRTSRTQRQFWNTALEGCPRWMRTIVYCFFGYAVLNFILFVAFHVRVGEMNGEGNETPAAVFRGFSGHWMAFYSAAMAILFSAARMRTNDGARRLPSSRLVGRKE